MIIHVPHSSVFIPTEHMTDFVADDLEAELLKMTDMYCDELFFRSGDMFAFPYSRLLCDVERFRSDEAEQMSSVGMGAVYTACSHGGSLRIISPEKREELLCRYYDPHHRAFTEAVDKRLRSDGFCLIIDAHSFHPIPLPYETDRNPQRPDFCIGTDSFHTPACLADMCRDFFASEGFSVEINRPFSGSIVPMKYYRRDARVKSVMIEVNRRLYMDESGRKTEGFESIRSLISCLLDRLSEA